MKDLLIKNGYVYLNLTFSMVDIIVHNGHIAGIVQSCEKISEEPFLRVIDARGLYVLPGFIDSHVHFNDPGREEWEGFYTGSKAACAGGITTVFDMPLNSSPSVIHSSILEHKKAHILPKTFVDFGLWGGLTADNVTHYLELKQMRDLGIVGFKAFLSESGINDFKRLQTDQLKDAMVVSKQLGCLLALHAEDNELIQRYTSQLYKEKRVDRQAFLESRPQSVEFSAIQHALKLAEETGATVHFVHVSCPEAIELIAEYKEQGVDVSVEVCPHYLLFDEQDFIQKGPLLKCAPPLRDRETVEKLWNCIAKGLVDIVGSDHSPCPLWMKEEGDADIWKAWGGIQGVQFGFHFFLSEAIRRRYPLETVAPFITSNVASRFNLSARKGSIEVGKDADFTIFNCNEKCIVTEANTYNRNKYSPYVHQKATGKIMTTIVRGQIVYENHNFKGQSGIGQDLFYKHSQTI